MGEVLSGVLNGLSYASTLFLMAAGLTLIFGVTRIVNFAHGSFYMLGALVGAQILLNWCPQWGDSAALYVLAMVLGAGAAAVVGGLSEYFLLRRLYGAPELYQLVATFGLSLFIHDGLRWALGPEELFAPRFPGLKGAVELAGNFFPAYQLLTIALGPLLWLVLHGVLEHTWWGIRLRAATLDRAMLSALGVNPKPLMLGAVVLGCGLAGLGGALQLPREPANLQMDMNMVVETFVVVVTGGLGSLAGAFLAAVLIGLVHALGSSLFPHATLVLVFATMGVVLTLRPRGLLGKPLAALPQEQGVPFVLWPASGLRFVPVALAFATSMLALGMLDPYWQSLTSDALILVVLGVSLQSMMALGGLVSFGHAAFFGVGAYAAAWMHLHWACSLPWALLGAGVASAALAAVVGGVMVRSAGVYLAMLSLALAQVVWAGASQWDAVTGGDNGLIGLQLTAPGGSLGFSLLLVVLALVSVALLRQLARSPLGAALQAVRDAPQRAQASGLPLLSIKYRIFVASATLAGLAGALFAAHKGSVFPAVASVSTSVDVLLVVLLGGLHQLWGSVAGALVLTLASSELGRGFDYWRGALGLLVMLIMVRAPSGILGLRWRAGEHGA
jgi:branched-chain amino acid transport system permease protein